MNRNASIEQLKSRFGSESEWAQFLAYIEDHKIRGDADEIWLQWDIHLLQRQAGQQLWHSRSNLFLPEAARQAEAQIL